MRNRSTTLIFLSTIVVASLTANAGPRSRHVEATQFLPPVEARAIPGVILEGSRWDVEFPKEIFSHAKFDFLPNGRLQALIDNGDSRLGWDKYGGTWAQDGNRVVVIVNGSLVYDGVVVGETIEGTVSRVDGTGKTPFIGRTGAGLKKFNQETAAEAVQVRKRMAEDASKTLEKVVEYGNSAQRGEPVPRESSGPVKVACSACSGRGGKALGYKGLHFGANFKRCRICDGTGLVWAGR